MRAFQLVSRNLNHTFGVTLVAVSLLVGSATISPAMGPDRSPAPQDGRSSQIGELVNGSGPFIVDGVILDRPALARVYRARNYLPVWADHPEAVSALLGSMAGAATDGIDPAAIGSEILASEMTDPALSPAARDALLTDRFIRYAGALVQGLVDPASTENDWALARPAFDPIPLLDRVAAGQELSSMLRALAPQRAEYDRLRDAFVRYTRIAVTGGWPALPAISPGDPRYASEVLPILRLRLVIEGDLPGDRAGREANGTALTGAIRRFQARHGLDVDGRIGPATLAALNVSAPDRAAQLGLALERMRAMPHDWPATRIVVNIPFATLTLFRNEEVALSSRVVVGDPRHPTPVLGSAIQSVLFNPSWDVPSSIVHNEMQARLARDPGYLERNHFLLLGRKNGESSDIDWSHTDILANGWRVQQQPGPWNALRIVMFDFPSPFAVYLHDTPARSAFALAARGLSHGCVRVEAANALAGELLGATASPDSIQKIVVGGATERHLLAEPMPVYLTYVTALVDEDGMVEFRDDLDGRDKRLMAALSAIDDSQSPRMALVPERRSPPTSSPILETRN